MRVWMLLAAGLLAAPAAAQTAEEKGLAIATEADARDMGWGAMRADGEMILRDPGGGETRRAFWSLQQESKSADEGDRSVIVFTDPRDIAGTATLTHSKIEPADDDQWLFLPAVKRVKRISSSNRTGKFVGSEFSFEDLGSNDVADYSYEYLRDEACPDDAALTCFVVASTPKNARSGYSRRVAWIDQAEYRLRQTEFYNRRGDLEKVLSITGYQQFGGKFWRPATMTMTNRQTGKSTDLSWTNYDFTVQVDDGDFNAQRLPRLAR